MVLIACPECKKSVSTAAISCPHCGFPLDSRELDIDKQAIVTDVAMVKEPCPHCGFPFTGEKLLCKSVSAKMLTNKGPIPGATGDDYGELIATDKRIYLSLSDGVVLFDISQAVSADLLRTVAGIVGVRMHEGGAPGHLCLFLDTTVAEYSMYIRTSMNRRDDALAMARVIQDRFGAVN